MQADQKPVIWTVVIASIVLLTVFLFSTYSVNTNLKLTADALSDISVDVDEQAIVNAIMAGIVMPEFPEAPVYPEFPEYMISEDDYEINLQEVEAERLAMDEMDSKDFREALFTAINAKIDILAGSDNNEQRGLDIISYRDIEDAYSIDVDDVVVSVIPETAIVTIDFKIKYILDDDEDLVGKARVTVIYDVLELVVDDEFDDAEVDEVEDIDFTVTHLYTNLI